MYYIRVMRLFFLIFSLEKFIFPYKYDDLVEFIDINQRDNTYQQSRSFVPKAINKKIENAVVKVGQQAILPCFIGNLGSYQVIWAKNGDILTLGNSKINTDHRLSIQHRYLNEWNLIIENVSTDDEGQYVCKTNGNFFKTISLQILVPPSFDDLLSTCAGNLNIEEGSEVSLKCYANAKPLPVIKWFNWKKYESFRTKKKELNFTGNNLIVASINRNDANMYECIAKNIIPPASSRIFSLIVQFLPVVYLEIHRKYEFVYKIFSLECKIEANPVERLEWYKDGILYDINLNDNNIKKSYNSNDTQILKSNVKFDKFKISKENEYFKILSILTVMNVKKHDYGEYKCCAANYLGRTCSSMAVKRTDIELKKKYLVANLTRNSYQSESKPQDQNTSDREMKDLISTGSNLDSKDKRRHFLVDQEKIKNLNINNFSLRLTANDSFILLYLIFQKYLH